MPLEEVLKNKQFLMALEATEASEHVYVSTDQIFHDLFPSLIAHCLD